MIVVAWAFRPCSFLSERKCAKSLLSPERSLILKKTHGPDAHATLRMRERRGASSRSVLLMNQIVKSLRLLC